VSFRRFFLVRLGWALFGLWLAATVVFLMFFVLTPDPARKFVGGDQARPSAIEWAQKEFHLSAPLHEQYGFYLWRLVAHQSPGPTVFVRDKRGPFIESGELARNAVPATASLVVAALMLALGVAVLVGRASARVHWRRIHNLPIYLAIGLHPVVVGIWLAYYLGVRWGVTPVGGYCDFFNPGTGCGGARNWLSHLVLPAITLSLFLAAVYTRIVHKGAGWVLAAKNPEERRKRRRRFALVLARVVGRDFGFVIGLAILVENIFGIPGLGRGALVAVFQGDFIALQAFVLYGAFLGIAVHLLVDVIVGALDPDLRAEWPVAGMPKRA
jgi:peptide/nickel transport system permease protein